MAPLVDSGAPAESVSAAAASAPWRAPSPEAIDGPHEDLRLEAGRPIFYARARDAAAPARLVGHLHGMCGAPSYACGKWVGAGTELGFMVCPTGNARCGDSAIGPPSWESSAGWLDLVRTMDADLEAAIAKVGKKHPGGFGRDGAVLTGYSRGAYAAAPIARLHPGRWPYLVLIEANVPLAAASLRASGVRAVALVGGEQGTEIAGQQKSLSELEAAAFPAKLFVMRRTGHLYSDDMEEVMHAALAWVTAH